MFIVLMHNESEIGFNEKGITFLVVLMAQWTVLIELMHNLEGMRLLVVLLAS